MKAKRNYCVDPGTRGTWNRTKTRFTFSDDSVLLLGKEPWGWRYEFHPGNGPNRMKGCTVSQQFRKEKSEAFDDARKFLVEEFPLLVSEIETSEL